MITPPAGLRVLLACGVTDMRKGLTGLAMLVQQGLAGTHSAGRCTPFAAAGPG